MNCEEVSELLPAYVLGALEPDEVDAVEAHLRQGREHDDELVELRATVFALDRYREDLIAPSVAAPASLPGGMPAARPRKRLLTRGWQASPWRSIAAAVAVLLLFGAGWLAAGIFGGDSAAYAVAVQGEGGSFMEIRGDVSGETVSVIMANLERVPEGRSYQVWAVRDDEGWTSIGTCNTNAEGWWHGDFDFQIRDGEAVALTIEPAGGSETPTGEPVLSSVH